MIADSREESSNPYHHRGVVLMRWVLEDAPKEKKSSGVPIGNEVLASQRQVRQNLTSTIS